MSNTAKRLFTPGPLMTKKVVREEMMIDLGSRDNQFTSTIDFVRLKLLEIAGVSAEEYASIIMQGSGTFGNESVIQTVTPRDSSASYLILENGAYGVRLKKICDLLCIKCTMHSFAEERALDPTQIEKLLENASYTHVGVIHNETTSGVLNPVKVIGQLVKKHLPNALYLVDSMSAFGAIPIDLKEANIDFLVSSSNKCIEGVPGFSFVICKKDLLLKCKGNSRSLSLDLFDQYESLEKTKQFRFTPPTHAILAFKQALVELEKEGGPCGRYKRYTNNHRIIREELLKFGFKELVPLDEQGKIINTFLYPNDENFNFNEFYERLSSRGMIIYPGKLTKAPCFRIGNIGQLYEDDMYSLVKAIKEVCEEMKIKLPCD